MLCDAMRWVYVCEVTNQKRADMIERFEALELTPALSLENETSAGTDASATRS